MRGSLRSHVLAALAAAVLAAPAAAQPSGGAAGPPGLSATSWKILSATPQQATVFNPSHLSRGQGWFTIVFRNPRSYTGVATNASYIQALQVADCAAGTLTNVAMAFYDSQGQPLRALRVPEPKANPVQPGSFGATQLALLCGRPAKLYADQPLNTRGTELLGVYAAMLDIQARGARTGLPPRPATAAGPPRAPPPAAAGPVRAPGLGEASWRVLFLNPTSASFFTPATIRRSGGGAIGWFTDIYARPQEASDAIRGISINQSLWEADCTMGTLRLAYVAYYRADGAPILQNPTDGLAPQPQRPGTTGGAKLDVLCGRKVELFSNEPMEMGVLGLRDVYATQLAFARNGSPPGQDAPASPPTPRPAAVSPAAQIPAPGMKVATWKFLTVVTDRAFLFVPSQVKRTAGVGQGWMMEAYRKPITLGPVRNISMYQYLYEADCARGTLTSRARVYYSATGTQLAALEGVGLVQPQRGSPAAEFANVLCGRPQELWDDDPYTKSGPEMLALYEVTMQVQEAVDGK